MFKYTDLKIYEAMVLARPNSSKLKNVDNIKEIIKIDNGFDYI